MIIGMKGQVSFATEVKVGDITCRNGRDSQSFGGPSLHVRKSRRRADCPIRGTDAARLPSRGVGPGSRRVSGGLHITRNAYRRHPWASGSRIALYSVTGLVDSPGARNCAELGSADSGLSDEGE
jgi:hypothetical protein